ncbi:MAG: hypothetical protein CMJ31_13305 [Phycisphaerae bacterium]|nr:hypothetical protein [Phycisphaerae bacterium]
MQIESSAWGSAALRIASEAPEQIHSDDPYRFERRRHARWRTSGEAMTQIISPDGSASVCSATIVDESGGGLGIESLLDAEVGSTIVVNTGWGGGPRVGVVRYSKAVERDGLTRFRIGLECAQVMAA